MRTSKRISLSAEELELIDKCLWQVSEAISIGLSGIDTESETGKTARQGISAIQQLRRKIKGSE